MPVNGVIMKYITVETAVADLSAIVDNHGLKPGVVYHLAIRRVMPCPLSRKEWEDDRRVVERGGNR